MRPNPPCPTPIMTAGSNSNVQQEELPLPRADHLHEGLVFRLLDRPVGGDEALAEDADQLLAILEYGDGFEEPARQRDLILVGRLRHRLADGMALGQAEIAAGERGG